MSFTPTTPQHAAIEAPLGPVLVVAGPGAGKTHCLIGRVHHLITELGFKPERICAVTFTNKAAEEITRRLKEEIQDGADDITKGTLHHQCVHILREHAETVGLRRGFGIADENYQKLVLRHLDVPRKRWQQLFTFFSRRRFQEYTLTGGDERIFRRYLELLRSRNMVDFDDIITLTAELFDKHPDIADETAARWDYLLVDEFQDLNRPQYAILKRLAQAHRNFFAVGDDEQSIFSWTGADPEVLKQFTLDFAIDAPIILDENQRCSRQIFDTARRMLKGNPQLFDKQLRAVKESEHLVRAYGFEDEEAEGEWVLSDLAADRNATGHSWGSYGILYRRHRVGNDLEKWLVRNGVPCRLVRGRSLQDDPVIAYIVASLRLLSSPDDPVAVQVFAEQVLPEHLLEQVRALMSGKDLGLIDAMREFALHQPKSDPDRRKAWRFIYHVENLTALGQSHSALSALVEELLAHRIGKYKNVLEDRHAELSDPAEDKAVVDVAARLESAVTTGAHVWIEPMAGVEIALRGMLTEVGAAADTLGIHDVEPHPSDLILRRQDGHEHGLPLTLFKALQLLHSREFSYVFGDYVAFDLETTDNDPMTCAIVEIGAARVRNGKIVDRFRSLVRSAKPISRKAQEIHGYTDEDVREAPSFEEVWPKFREFIGEDLLVAHNGQRFDVPVLKRVAHGLPGIDDLVFFDTLPLARSLYQESARLEDLATRFGIDKGRAHHAEDDAVTLAQVFAELSRQKVLRARKSALVNLLDFVGLALALDRDQKKSPEHRLLADLAVPFTLGRYSDCLEFYGAERERTGATDAPTLERVIEWLGGRDLMERIRTEREPARRYPTAVARLNALLDASRAESLDESIRLFLDLVALSTSDGAEKDPHRVNLLTLHSTKGLEFSRVYVVGVEDFQIPGYYQVIDNREDEIEEARRLLYVGMTRAEDRLVLTRVDRRFGRDTGGNRFLDEMDIECERPGHREVSAVP